VSVLERVALQSAFVLHGRPWRETSELLEVFSADHGRASLLARGLRRPRSGLRAILQPFQPLTLSWSGRSGALMTLAGAEADGPAVALQAATLMSGFYVNELLLRFLHKGDPHPQLFAAYGGTLAALAAGEPAEAVLRRFELGLLAETGYGLSLEHDAVTGEPLDPRRAYSYAVERGPLPTDGSAAGELVFSGAELQAIGRCDFSDPASLGPARRLLRAVLDHHLGGRPLRTRQVYGAMRR
jgi:DNA repair protein RecO (recombination protein O)